MHACVGGWLVLWGLREGVAADVPYLRPAPYLGRQRVTVLAAERLQERRLREHDLYLVLGPVT